MNIRIIKESAELQFEVEAPTTMLLNLACMHTTKQSVVDESLIVAPNTVIDFLPVGDAGSRLARIRLDVGPAQIQYTAKASPDTCPPGYSFAHRSGLRIVACKCTVLPES